MPIFAAFRARHLRSKRPKQQHLANWIPLRIKQILQQYTEEVKGKMSEWLRDTCHNQGSFFDYIYCEQQESMNGIAQNYCDLSVTLGWPTCPACAPFNSHSEPTALRMQPTITYVEIQNRPQVMNVGDTVQLYVVAHYADGTTQDVTFAAKLTDFYVSDASNLQVSETGLVAAVAPGVGHIYVAVTSQAAPDLCGVAEFGDTLEIRVASDDDADADGMSNDWEVANGLDPFDTNDAGLDLDFDGLTNLEEYGLQTDPHEADTDGDSLDDGQEVSIDLNPTDPAGLGDGWTVAINGQHAVPLPRGGFQVPNISAADLFGEDGTGSSPDFLSDDFLRVTGTATINDLSYYAFTDPFQIRQGETFLVGDLTITKTPPPLPQSIAIDAPDGTVLEPGQTSQLVVTGTLGDGTQIDVTPRSAWTIYRTSNPAVASVGQDGLVSAGQQVGTAFITATNEGAAAAKRITVTAQVVTTTVEGFVQLEDGTPVEGAVAVTPLGGMGTSDDAGHFAFEVQVASRVSSLSVRASAQVKGRTYSGTVVAGPVMPGGVTDAGVITLTATEMLLIPAGEYAMGDHHDGDSSALPVHAVYIDAFYLDKYEVTNQQYADALNWALKQGSLITVTGGVVYRLGGVSVLYCDTTSSSSYSRITWNGGSFGVVAGKEDHPMVQVSWYGAAAYANWRSGMDGLQPSYDTATWVCDFGASGYRLATEAEWEKAARGGLFDPYRRYPWGDSITGANANYFLSGDPYEQGAYPWTTPVGYYDGGQTPAGGDMANGYGLYDMAGNAWEWCNDWYSGNYYSVSPYNNPQGSASSVYRVLRGGSWFHGDYFLRCASRYDDSPGLRFFSIGFRLALD